MLPLAPELAAAVERAEEGPEGSVRAPREYEVVDRRTIVVAGLALATTLDIKRARRWRS